MIRIAIVDDEREILELLFRIIDDTLKREQAQFEITTFLKAEELLSSHREKPFQIIFADLEMPDVDGLHLAEELRKEDQHTLFSSQIMMNWFSNAFSMRCSTLSEKTSWNRNCRWLLLLLIRRCGIIPQNYS